MRGASVATLLLLSACGRGAMNDAEAFERGANGPRDYRKSAAIYERLCVDGRGDPLACRRFILAVAGGRGVDLDRRRAGTIAATMCERGQLYGCAMGAALETAPFDRDDESPRNQALLERFEHMEETCAARDADACATWLLISGIGFGKDTIEGKDAFPTLLCERGELAACERLVDLRHGCESEDPEGPCMKEKLAGLKENPDTPSGRAYARVQAACDAGDVDACNGLPWAEISLADRCAAYDYDACAELSCAGKASLRTRARALATAHGAAPRCESSFDRHPATVTAACKEAGTRLARRVPGVPDLDELRDELIQACEDQAWSPSWQVCIVSDGGATSATCADQLADVIKNLTSTWSVLLTLRQIVECPQAGQFERAHAARELDRLYGPFDLYSMPAGNVELTAAHAADWKRDADENLSKLAAWGCPAP
jgi:hypothetical protein